MLYLMLMKEEAMLDKGRVLVEVRRCESDLNLAPKINTNLSVIGIAIYPQL